MSADAELAELASLCGIFDKFRDLAGVTRPTTPETQRALLRATGLEVDTAAQVQAALADRRAQQQNRDLPEEVVIACDAPASLRCGAKADWHVKLDGRDDIFAEGRAENQINLPPLPMGLHHLAARVGGSWLSCRVIAAPARTPSLPEVAGTERSWGVVAALYGLRSRRNSGPGDFEDLAQLAETLGPLGVGFLGLNPVHALGWSAEDVISPYSPTHRGFLNVKHLARDKLTGLVSTGVPAPPDDDLVDYATHDAAHRSALRAAYAAFQSGATAADRAALLEFEQAAGQPLLDFARFECLSASLGQDWRAWPDHLQSPQATYGGDPGPDMAFHMWLQWQADRQLAEAHARARSSGMGLGLYLDLAVGARRDGAEAWSAGGSLARGVSLGAPPDHLSPAGQNWQLAAYAPQGLAAQDYAPLRQVLRQAMRHCGVLRIDHVLGLNRSYWIPDDGSPGGYIRQPFQSLMAIIAIEAHRAGTMIVGEDLGLVPDGFRDTMAAKGFYGYTVLQYEKNAAGHFRDTRDLRAQSLACFGTHDTPTVAGFWSGRDIDWWHRLGWIDAQERASAEQQRAEETAALLQRGGGLPDNASAPDLRDAVHQTLAEGPTALAAVQLDDLLDVEQAQNLPGTVDEHPNWRRRSPVAIEDLAKHDGLEKTARIMAKANRGRLKQEI